MKKTLIFAITIGCCCIGTLFAHTAKKEVKKDDTMIKLDTQVRSLILEQGDYDAALKAYAAAARQNTAEPYYKDQYAILRRVIKMKRAMEKYAKQPTLSEAKLTKWKSYYQAIRGYYYDQGFYSESISLDKTAFERLKTDSEAINYLESLLILNKTSEAQTLIAKSSDAQKASPGFAALTALLDARAGKTVNVAETEKKLNADPQTNPRGFVYLGCVYQIQDQQKKAFKAIATALENTPPTQITMTRKLIDRMQDFKDVRQEEKYLAAVKTESKVYQSGCTGGSSCNSCSLKDTCPSNQ